MKKIFSFILVLTISFVLAGCSSNEVNTTEDSNTNNTEQAVTKDLSYFKEEAERLVTDSTESEVYYSMVGATNGVKIYNSDESLRIEIYEFDEDSGSYKEAEEDQQLCISDDYCFSATVKNGYALLIDDDFPNYDEIISIFNDLD